MATMTLTRTLTINVLGLGVASVLIVALWGQQLGIAGVLLLSIVLLGGVISAVHHVDVIAAYVGRVFGAVILALAVTIIEVSSIVSVLVASGESAASLARDTVFAAVMIATNGIIGLSVVAATLRSSTSSFNTLKAVARRSVRLR